MKMYFLEIGHSATIKPLLIFHKKHLKKTLYVLKLMAQGETSTRWFRFVGQI